MPTPFSDHKLTQFRSWFPHTDKQRTYLNHAAISPLSTKVVAALHQHIENRHSGDIVSFEHDVVVMKETKQLIADLIGAESPDRIAFTANTSAGIHMVADNYPWQEGDEILLNTMEFPSNVYPFLNQRKKGVVVKEIDASDGRVPLDKIEAAITPKTKMLALSAVQFHSGYRSDLAAVGALCKERGIVFSVDAIQALGISPVDVQAMNIDALSAASHKWLMAPMGLGFLYVAKSLQEIMDEHYYGWFSVKDPGQLFNRDQELSDTAGRFESGGVSFHAIHGMRVSLETLLDIGIPHIREHILYLTDLLLDGIWGLNVPIISNFDKDHRAGIITVGIPDEYDIESIKQQLDKEKITVTIRDRTIRIAPHFYNNGHEIMHTANVLRYVLSKKNQ